MRFHFSARALSMESYGYKGRLRTRPNSSPPTHAQPTRETPRISVCSGLPSANHPNMNGTWSASTSTLATPQRSPARSALPSRWRLRVTSTTSRLFFLALTASHHAYSSKDARIRHRGDPLRTRLVARRRSGLTHPFFPRYLMVENGEFGITIHIPFLLFCWRKAKRALMRE
jgi:hypothetical protein